MFNFQEYKFPMLGLVRLPEIKLTNDERKLVKNGENMTNFQFLERLSKDALLAKIPSLDQTKVNEYKKQLVFELNLVEELSFTDYFLLVWRVINKAKSLGAYIDAGRGSCVSSLVFYVLGVTGVDPVEKKLFFARFISKVRSKKQVIDGITYLDGDLAPDVDLNVSIWRKDICLWLNDLYPGRISKIATLGTLTGKILVKDVYKTFALATEEQAKDVADLIEKYHGIVEDIENMPEKSPEFRKWTQDNTEVFNICLGLRDLIRSKGCHASGYLISSELLDDTVPMELNKDKDLMCGLTKDYAAKVAIKLDLLGLTTNKIIKDVLNVIPEKEEDIIKKLDNDPFIYDKFQTEFLPYGLYQISAPTAYKVARKVKPKNIFELSDVNAIARPGALDYLTGYVENITPPPHPAFKDCLSRTHNYCLYQEQMLQMAITVGFTAEESEQLRRIAGKKKVDEVKEWKDKIYSNCSKNGFSKEVGDVLWKILDDSSKYSFNFSHSAATSYISATTLYLKYKYPLQFYTACLNNASFFPDPTEQIELIQKELPHFGIKILPPRLCQSGDLFQVEGENIRFPLSNIKGFQEKTLNKVYELRGEYKNKLQLFNAAKQSKVSISALCGLIMAGTLEGIIKERRSHVMAQAGLWWLLKDKEWQKALEVCDSYNCDLFAIVKAFPSMVDEKGKPFIKESRLATIKKHFEPHMEIYKQNKKNEDLTGFMFETYLLGFAYSKSLYDIYIDKCPELITISQANSELMDAQVKIIGLVEESVRATSKAGNDYFRIKVVGHDASVSCYLFKSKKFDRILDCQDINGKLPEEGEVVICSGTKKDGAIFCNNIAIQETLVYKKISELKN